jgi:uncharacterized protein YlxP (DUF503 family)
MSALYGQMEMTVYFPSSFSLKDKRKSLSSLLDQIRNNLNASAAEVEHQDRHRLSTISVAVTNSSRNRIDQVFDNIKDVVDAEPTLQIRELDRSIV